MSDATTDPSNKRTSPRLIDQYAPSPHGVERHSIKVDAEADAVYRAIWHADLGSSWVVGALMLIRSLPRLVKDRHKPPGRSGTLTLHSMIGSPFGLVSEVPGRQALLGVEGRFWRPADNFIPFEPEHYNEPVQTGLARAVWSFEVEQKDGVTELITETRITCGDPLSRRRFRTYWFIVRPASGLIRRVMLRAIRDTAESEQVPST